MKEEDNNVYDEEPVVFCSKCYSLKIVHDDFMDMDFCGDCGCPDTLSGSIEEWEKLYEGRYRKKLIEKGTDPRKSPLFKASIDKLKSILFEHPSWKEIITTLYPHFPQNLGRADSVLFLFDKMTKDGKLDEFRLLLLKYLRRKNHGREEKSKGS